MYRGSTRWVLLVLACLSSLASPRAQAPAPATADPWYGRQAKPKNIDKPMVFPGTLSIELPKDWVLGPGHTGTIFSAVERKKGRTGGLILLEYMQLQAPLTPAIIAGAGQRILSEVQARERSGKQFTSAVKDAPFGPFILIQYRRPGLNLGTEDHVVQYSMPFGTTMYQLICIAPAEELEKYRPIFGHVAASFRPLQASGT